MKNHHTNNVVGAGHARDQDEHCLLNIAGMARSYSINHTTELLP
jgi:hypothetical protein